MDRFDFLQKIRDKQSALEPEREKLEGMVNQLKAECDQLRTYSWDYVRSKIEEEKSSSVVANGFVPAASWDSAGSNYVNVDDIKADIKAEIGEVPDDERLIKASGELVNLRGLIEGLKVQKSSLENEVERLKKSTAKFRDWLKASYSLGKMK